MPLTTSNRCLPRCGCIVIIDNSRKYLPLVHLDAQVSIRSSTSRTTLTQIFANPSKDSKLTKARYVFPLYDGVSVVGFSFTVGSRVVKGVVKERQEAKKTFDDATSQGFTAGLLEQSADASDVFSTTLGNIPAGEKVKVEITYLGELKHDAQIDGLRFTIPTSIAPRYGESSLSTLDSSKSGTGIAINVDVDMSEGSIIKSIQSTSHPISVTLGTTLAIAASSSSPSPLQHRASVALSLATLELDKDFILQIAATGLGQPAAVLETHPTIPNQRALMMTLVPRFNLPAQRPEVVFVCDRSGSMRFGRKIPNLISALQIFLKSLPIGINFNICSFGSEHSFLFRTSQPYQQEALEKAIEHVNGFDGDFGGTEMYQPIKETFDRRLKNRNLEVFLLTDGEVWEQNPLFELINEEVDRSKGAIRVFTLGVGRDVSHSLIEGVARAGNGFAQLVGEEEKMDKKVVRMLKGALTPHIRDYTLEIKYEKDDDDDNNDDDFELIEKVADDVSKIKIEDEGEEPENVKEQTEAGKKPIPLFDPNVKDEDLEMSAENLQPKLPAVTEPRYLQAPFKVPPLFPFNRTTVYILLSDSTPTRRPKAAILRGTWDEGPLELEIPIARLAEKGSTVHQLAAKRAIGELEEGRGWIYHARDESGRLLKDQFEGVFSNMVKREAVRLGVRYQIGGKWCSFVAVQEEKEAKSNEGDDGDFGDFEIWSVGTESAGIRPVGTMAMKTRSLRHFAPTVGPFMKAKMTTMACRVSAPSPPAMGAADPMVQGFSMMQDTTSHSLFEKEDASSGDADVGENVGPVSELASLQNFAGNWAWDSRLEKVLGITKEEASSVGLPISGYEQADDVLATLCAVLFLKKKCAQEKESWELFVQKAEEWIAGKTSDWSNTLEEIAETMLFC